MVYQDAWDSPHLRSPCTTVTNYHCELLDSSFLARPCCRSGNLNPQLGRRSYKFLLPRSRLQNAYFIKAVGPKRPVLSSVALPKKQDNVASM